jgi:hypothetical protein
VTRTALDGLRVADVMTPDPVRVPGGISVDVFAEGVLAAQRQTAALVVEAGGTIAGVAGMAEVGSLRGSARRDRRVRDIALPLASLARVRPDEDLLEALERVAAEHRAATTDAPWGGAGRRPDPGYLLVVAPVATDAARNRAGQAAPGHDTWGPVAPPPPPAAAVTLGSAPGDPIADEPIVGIVTPADLARTLQARSLSVPGSREARPAP